MDFENFNKFGLIWNINSDVNGEIILWDLKSKKQIVKWKAHNEAVLSIQYIYNKEIILRWHFL